MSSKKLLTLITVVLASTACVRITSKKAVDSDDGSTEKPVAEDPGNPQGDPNQSTGDKTATDTSQSTSDDDGSFASLGSAAALAALAGVYQDEVDGRYWVALPETPPSMTDYAPMAFQLSFYGLDKDDSTRIASDVNVIRADAAAVRHDASSKEVRVSTLKLKPSSQFPMLSRWSSALAVVAPKAYAAKILVKSYLLHGSDVSRMDAGLIFMEAFAKDLSSGMSGLTKHDIQEIDVSFGTNAAREVEPRSNDAAETFGPGNRLIISQLFALRFTEFAK